MGSAPLQNRLRGGLVKIYRGKSGDGYKKRGKDAVLVKTADFFSPLAIIKAQFSSMTQCL